MPRHLAALAALFSAACLGSYTPTGGPGPDPSSGDPPMNANRPPAGDPAAAPPDLAEAAPIDLSGPPAVTGTVELTLASTSESIRLNDTKEVTVTLNPTGGFMGTVTYAVEGLPAGATATFDPPGGMITGAATTKLTLKTAADTLPQTGVPLTIKATSGAISGSTSLTLDVQAELLVRIAKGVAIGTQAQPNLTAFGAETINSYFVAPGTKVTFVNEDSINHRIHADGDLGLGHQAGNLLPNAANAYSDTLTGSGTIEFRCHIHPNMRGKIELKPMP
jgi:plastocyanin